MDLNKALEHAAENSKFLKIRSGQTVEGCFIGEIKSKEFIDKNTGMKNISYIVNFDMDGVVKEMTVSAGFLRQLQIACDMDNVTLSTGIFKIRRDGEQMQTRWTVRARPKLSNPVTQVKEMFNGEELEPEMNEVPF